tara:strand:+ start:63388 stop:63672 length:285 start_codon:yes stop_codon:yes gene_type:complete
MNKKLEQIYPLTVEQAVKELKEWLGENLRTNGYHDFNIDDLMQVVTSDLYRIYVGGARVADFTDEIPTLDNIKKGYIDLIKMLASGAGIQSASL